MSAGLYPAQVLVERFVAAPALGNQAQVFVAPCDLEVVGLVAVAGTAPSAGAVTINISDSPTSQIANVAAYNLWTAANVPTIAEAATKSFTTSASDAFGTAYGTLLDNQPYALDYPFPGPSGTSGYETAQSTALTTQSPVTSPPALYIYSMEDLVAPDNTYSDYNGITQPASWVHAGDVLTFVLGGTITSLANLEIVLYLDKH